MFFLYHRSIKMTHKEIEKQNFILWYGLYATDKDMELARTNHKETLNRLLKEYAEEIDKIDRTKHFYEQITMPERTQIQQYDATLKINYSPMKLEEIILKKSL